ncbi:MAG: T9SS type A sorting domain-containing protein [Bacteroidetes bacterium]|nr:T9SS type A sorting domain-containing protein [Bacteroidota bacterium]
MKTKQFKFWFTLLIFLGNQNLFSQTSDWLWAKSFGGINSEFCTRLKGDNNGNLYMIGVSRSDSITFDTITLTNNTSNQSFIVKFNSLGSTEWVKKIPPQCSITSIALDLNGDLIVVGTFYNYNPTFDTITLVNQGGGDIFIAKYNSSGNLLWAKSAGTFDHEETTEISADNNGNIFITGNFTGHSFPIGGSTLINSGAGGTWEFFVAMYDMNGNPIWATAAGGLADDRSKSISVNSFGEVYITGSFRSQSITLQGETLTNTSLESDFFVAKYSTSNGSLVWAKGALGNDIDVGYSITTDAMGNAIICGEYYQAPITFGSITLPCNGAADVFLVKFDRSGNVVWARGFGGTSSEFPGHLFNDLNGNIWITGGFYSSSINFGNNIITNPFPGSENAYVLKFNSSNGTITWADNIGGIDDDYGSSASSDIYGNIFVAGDFNSYTINIDTINLYNAGMAATSDLFLAKLSATIDIKEEINSENSFSIFPNPNDGNIILQYSNEMVDGLICIWNLLGEKVYFKNLDSYENRINCKLNKGMYLIQLIKGNQILQGKC